MTRDPDLARAIRSWLDEGADRLPERVLDAVLDAVPTTHQRRRWMPAWRFAMLPKSAQAAIAVALVAMVVVAGVSLVTRGGVAAPGPTIAPSPSASPPPAPSTTPVPTGGPLGGFSSGTILGAGTYTAGSPFAVPFAIRLPAGTQADNVTASEVSVIVNQGQVAVFTPDAVFPDPCRATTPTTPVSTADELATALQSMTDFAVTDAGEDVVDGHPAQQFVVSNAIDTATAGCSRELMLPLFTTPTDTEGAATNGGARQVMWVLDVGGRPILIVGDGWSDSSRPELETIVRSIRFD
jgi:hypothetical protein